MMRRYGKVYTAILLSLCVWAPLDAAEEAPPLPFHTIEGYGGGAITPMAYLVNPAPPDSGYVFGKPAAAMTWINAGRKDLEVFSVSDTLWGRLEFSYAADRLGVGSLEAAIHNFSGLHIATNDVWLHNLNLRTLLVKEGQDFAGLKMPAVTAGVHFKYNGSIGSIDNELGGALSGIGLAHANSEDFTLTTTKTFAHLLFDRPVIATAGLRLSEAADVGFLGFSDAYRASFEGNVAYLPCDWLLVAYEFRQKSSPYGEIPTVIGDEDNWHAVDAALILSEHATLVAGWAALGNLGETRENGAWFLQLKYEM